MAEEIIAKAEELHGKKQFKEVFEFLTEAHKNHPTNVEIGVRFARAYFDLAETASDAETKKQLFTESNEIAKKMVQLDDKCAKAHKWMAISTSSLGDFVSTKEKIGNSYVIKEHGLKARELDPTDATTSHLLGRWCYSVSNIGWMERKLAQTLFASPPTSTFEEALTYFLEADKQQANFLRNCIYIGDTYTALKQYDNAREAYKRAAAMPYEGEVETKLHEDAVAKAAK